MLILHNYDYYLDSVKNKHGKEASLILGFKHFNYHSLIVTCLADLSHMKYGIEYAQSIERDITKLHNASIEWDSRTIDWLFQRNRERGVDCEDISIAWTATEKQKRMMELGVDNNLKTHIMIHPSLLFESKLIPSKQVSSQVPFVLFYEE